MVVSALPEHTFTLGARVCLGGEGLGLYKGKAITVPIKSLSTSISVHTNLDQGVRLFRRGASRERSGNFSEEVMAVCRTYNKFGFYPDNIDISITSSVPIGYGLASSATFYACLATALNNYFSYNLTETEIIQVAYDAEHVDQGVLVGLTDTYAVIRRGILFQDHSHTPSRITELHKFPSHTSLVIAGSTSSSYKSTGAQLKERVLMQEEGIMRYTEKVSELIPLLARAFSYDDKIGVSDTTARLFESVCFDMRINNLDYCTMVTAALQAGAYAAKNIGLRSTGGSVFALCSPELTPQVVQALAKHGAFVHVVPENQIK